MKKFLVVLGLLALIAGGAAWWTLSSLDSLVKGALEHYGPRALGVTVKVDDVKISTQNGRGEVRGMFIGNPSGYAAPYAVKVGTAAMAVDASTLTSDLVVIREITVDSPDIIYELVGGKANLEVIRTNIEGYLAQDAGAKPTDKNAKPQERSGRRYVIHAANIRKAQVRVTNPLLKGGGISFTLPDITLRNIGNDGRGVSGGEAARIVTSALVARIAARALTGGQLIERGLDGALDMLKEFIRPQ